MHDLTYANQIIDRLKTEVAEGRKTSNITVDVYLSPFSHVTPERLKEVFGLLTEEEGYTNAVLEIGILEFCIHCNKCDQTWKSAEPTFHCPKCGSSDFELNKMEEFCIGSIKIGR